MRFTIPTYGILFPENRRTHGERSLALRLAGIFLPGGVALCLFVGWLGHQAASSVLHEVLPVVPLLEAEHQAEKIQGVLEGLRNGLFVVAQEPDLNAQKLREKLPVFFRDSTKFIAEFGIKSQSNSSFLLLRDKDERFVPVPPFFASQGPYAPFLQVDSQPPPGQVSLYPAMRTHYAGALAPDQVLQKPVVRMALPLGEGRDILVLGLDLERLHALLSLSFQPDAPPYAPAQDDALRLAYFFEPSGWIVFELGNQAGQNTLFPDTVRRGYEGDLGRPGLDAAFRPWAAHESYWRMVTDVLAGQSGSLPFSPRHYAFQYAGASAALCYTPVTFAPAPDAPARIVGGLAFLETSSLPLRVFYRAVNAGLIIVVAALAVLSLLVFTAGRRLADPLRLTAGQLQDMLHSGRLVPLTGEPVCKEQQALIEAGNGLITRNIALQADLERMELEMQQARSILPVDLDEVTASHDRHENFGLVGSSFPMQKVREEVRKAGRIGADVLIWGETGTGKELVAAAVHQAGVSTEGPFISINCGALDENLLLDALFGHVKGAFSEAKADRKGAFVSAEGGTLFLDEIANASLKVQQSLLRALSVRRVRPLGTDAELPFTARVVASTNVDLRDQVRKGLFREDLYYRLAIISIATPALRRRKEDIPELAAFFIREAGKRLARAPVRLSRGALEAMMEHSWPGNVRELKNCITRAMAFMEGDLILRRHILIDSGPTTEEMLHAQNFAEGGRGEEADSAPDEPEVFDYSWEYLWPRPSSPPRTPDAEAAPRAPSAPEGGVPDETRGGEKAGRDDAGPADAVFPAGAERDGEEDAQGDGAPDFLRHAAGLPALNRRQMLALQHIRTHGVITRAEYERLVGRNISARTMQNDLRHLVELGVLKRLGGGPKTRYTLSRQIEK